MSGKDVESLAAYDAVAKDYAAAAETKPYNALYERPAVIELLGEVSGKRVLDVGCGAGPLSQWLVEHGATVVGFDISSAMLAIARERRLPNATFHIADLAEPLTFLPDGAFDVAVASLVMHYVRDWEAPLNELRRVLVPGGSLVLSTHHPADDITLSATGNYFDLELLHDRWKMGETMFDVDFWRRPLTAMFSAFSEAGFTVEVLREPMPDEACRTQFPEAWKTLTRKPAFIFFRLVTDGGQPRTTRPN